MLTYKFRVRDKHAGELNRQARAVNFVWNFCNEAQKHALKWGKQWPTGYDLQKLTAGSSKELGLHGHTIQRVCMEYEKARKTRKKAYLNWRGKKSLGWVPFNTGKVQFEHDKFVFRGQEYSVWLSREIPAGTKLGAGSFNQDAKGNWYINIPVDLPATKSEGTSAAGIDLGLKDFAALSTGEIVNAQRFYRGMEEKLAAAQQAGKKQRVRAIHAKIGNRRKDFLHKLSTRLVQENAAIFVGDVNSSSLSKTNMAKSVMDAGWSTFRTMLEYKAIRHQVEFAVISEKLSTQICSGCGSVAGPKGRAGLNEREWDCPVCGAHHQRDVNAAVNIRERGLALLAEGILSRKT